MHREHWLPVSGYEGFYEVSDMGRVRSVKTTEHYRGCIRKPCITATGYPQLVICKNTARESVSVHRLVALAFIPNPDKLPHINHKNGIKSDCRLENLEWCTVSANRNHALKNGLAGIAMGSRLPQSKLSSEIVREARSRYIPYKVSAASLAKEYNVTAGTMAKALRKETWKHVP